MSVADLMREYLGGEPNIVRVQPCIARLRVEVKDPGLVDPRGLRAVGAHGVVIAGNIVQVVVGKQADQLAPLISQ
ncbi:MAG: PTS transporter subunit EIIB [Bifidobacteriaceae bacterium]|jgi:PTS system N-acetylglucosamine-specific IIB component|nr:PTS transporter subunit EIIB [Bifidobacteriaceae bacterium]